MGIVLNCIIVRRGSAPTISEKIHIKSAICRRGLNLDSYERQESKLVMYATQITNTSDLHLQFIVKKYFQFGLFAPPMGQDGQAGWCKAPPGRFALYAWASYPTTVKLYCKMKKKFRFVYCCLDYVRLSQNCRLFSPFLDYQYSPGNKPQRSSHHHHHH